MRVNFILGSFPVLSETFVINQILSTIRSGHEVKIFVRDLLKISESSQIDLIKKYDLNSKIIKLVPNRKNNLFKLMSRHIVFYSKIIYKLWRMENFKVKFSNLDNFLLLLNFKGMSDQICHAQFGDNGKYIALAKKLGISQCLLMTTFHGYDVSLDYVPENFRSKYYDDLFTYGNLFTVNTPFLASELIKLGCPHDRLKVVPMGVDTNFFTPKDTNYNDKIILLSVGRLIRLKSFDYGILAVSELLKLGLEIEYRIIGDGDDRNKLEQLVSALCIDNHVSFLGSLSQQEVLNNMRESDVFLMTSTFDESGRREAQGVVLAEAQSCGIPICGFRSGGVPYAVLEGRTGLLAEESNIDEFIDNLTVLISDKELREQFGQNARKFVIENYSLDKMRITFSELYSELLAKQIDVL